MKTEVTQVERTEDYTQFKPLAHNRVLNKAHVNRLADAMTERPGTGSIRPILVNERMEIIDGQHRYKAAEQIGAPIYFIVGHGLRLEDAQRLNALQKNWNEMDYAKSFADAGAEDYQYYLEYRKNHHISHSVALAYLTDGDWSGKSTVLFRAGAFKIKDKNEAERLAAQLEEIGAYFNQYRQKAFGLAFQTLAQHPKYDHKVMVAHAKSYAGRFLRSNSNINECLRDLENLYNYRLSQDKTIKIF